VGLPRGASTFVVLALSAFVPTESMPGIRLFAENQSMTPIIETIRSLLVTGSAENNALIAVLWCSSILIVSYILAMQIYKHKTV